MYQIIQSAKIARCDETGSLGIVVGNEVMPVGGLPFGDVKITEEVVQPECQPELKANEDIFNRFFIEGVANLTVGETYIVNWNGVEYRCVAKTPDMVSYDAAPVYAILGNIAKIEETGDTGEPFLIRVGRYRDNYPSEYQIYAFDGATELTLSLRHYTETINKLSGKYVEGMGWSEKSTKEVLPETFVAEPAQQESGLNLYQINCALEGGKKYTVIYNGVAYDVISHALDGPAIAIVMGNFALIGDGDDTGEPFLISFNPNMGGTMVGTLDSGGITIVIYGEGETIHPIDKKYLPVGSGGINVYAAIWYENEEFHVETFDGSEFNPEVAIQTGKTIVVQRDGLMMNVIATNNTGSAAIDMWYYDIEDGAMRCLRFSTNNGRIFVPIG